MDKNTKIVIAVAVIYAMNHRKKKNRINNQVSVLVEELNAYIDGFRQITFDEKFKDIVNNYDK